MKSKLYISLLIIVYYCSLFSSDFVVLHDTLNNERVEITEEILKEPISTLENRFGRITNSEIVETIIQKYIENKETEWYKLLFLFSENFIKNDEKIKKDYRKCLSNDIITKLGEAYPLKELIRKEKKFNTILSQRIIECISSNKTKTTDIIHLLISCDEEILRDESKNNKNIDIKDNITYLLSKEEILKIEKLPFYPQFNIFLSEIIIDSFLNKLNDPTYLENTKKEEYKLLLLCDNKFWKEEENVSERSIPIALKKKEIAGNFIEYLTKWLNHILLNYMQKKLQFLPDLNNFIIRYLWTNFETNNNKLDDNLICLLLICKSNLTGYNNNKAQEKINKYYTKMIIHHHKEILQLLIIMPSLHLFNIWNIANINTDLYNIIEDRKKNTTFQNEIYAQLQSNNTLPCDKENYKKLFFLGNIDIMHEKIDTYIVEEYLPFFERWYANHGLISLDEKNNYYPIIEIEHIKSNLKNILIKDAELTDEEINSVALEKVPHIINFCITKCNDNKKNINSLIDKQKVDSDLSSNVNKNQNKQEKASSFGFKTIILEKFKIVFKAIPSMLLSLKIIALKEPSIEKILMKIPYIDHKYATKFLIGATLGLSFFSLYNKKKEPQKKEIQS